MRRCCVQDTIDRIAQLEAAGRLTGLMDDRGKVCHLVCICPRVTFVWDAFPVLLGVCTAWPGGARRVKSIPISVGLLRSSLRCG